MKARILEEALNYGVEEEYIDSIQTISEAPKPPFYYFETKDEGRRYLPPQAFSKVSNPHIDSTVALIKKESPVIGETMPNNTDFSENHDNHYASQKFEPIDIIEQKVIEWTEAGVPPEKAYNMGQALKYIFRAGLKDDLNKELDKALNYLTRAQTGEWRK